MIDKSIMLGCFVFVVFLQQCLVFSQLNWKKNPKRKCVARKTKGTKATLKKWCFFSLLIIFSQRQEAWLWFGIFILLHCAFCCFCLCIFNAKEIVGTSFYYHFPFWSFTSNGSITVDVFFQCCLTVWLFFN